MKGTQRTACLAKSMLITDIKHMKQAFAANKRLGIARLYVKCPY